MGACTQKMKKVNKEAQEKRQQGRGHSVQHSKSQSVQTQESVQEKERINRSLGRQQSALNFNQTIILQTCKMSRCYSLLQNVKTQYQVNTQHQQNLEQVQIVQHNLTGRIRTMEILNKNESKTIKYLDRLMQYQLSHPHISQVHDIFQEDNQVQIITDYCSGGKLQTLALKQGQGLDEKVALKILVQMIEAVNYIHQKKLTHGHLTNNSFQRIDESSSYFVKLIDIKPIYIKKELTFEELTFTAPEIINNEKEYSISRDVWSIGIIFYMMLTGNSPYEAITIQKLKQEVKKGVMSFSQLQFDKISKQSKDIITRLLQRNPAMRSNLSSICKMNFYKNVVQQTKEISKQALGMMTNAKPANQIQTLFLQFLVNQFCQNQQVEIHQMFKKYDQNGDAKLNKNEIYELLLEQLKSKDIAKRHVDSIFKAVDTDQNGTLDCHEFIRCIIDRQALITTINLKIVFKMITDGRGAITKKRFMNCFQVDEKQTDQMFATVTQSKRITLKVFSKIMMELI